MSETVGLLSLFIVNRKINTKKQSDQEMLAVFSVVSNNIENEEFPTETRSAITKGTNMRTTDLFLCEQSV